MAKEKYVRIQTNEPVQVNAGLDFIDNTLKNSRIEDKLKVTATWHLEKCMLHSGTHYYPAEVADWPTTKALAKHGLITIGEKVEQIPDEFKDDVVTADAEQTLKEGKEDKARLEEAAKIDAEQANDRAKVIKDVNLEAIAEANRG